MRGNRVNLASRPRLVPPFPNDRQRKGYSVTIERRKTPSRLRFGNHVGNIGIRGFVRQLDRGWHTALMVPRPRVMQYLDDIKSSVW